MKNEIIVLSGNIGVGKTTLGPIISKPMNSFWISESQIYDNFKYLAAESSKKEKYITQIAFPVSRLSIILSSYYENSNYERIITERFLWDDLIFYKVWDSIYNFNNNSFYESLNKILIQLSNDFLIKTIYLKCDIDVIMRRILSRYKVGDYQFTKEIILKIENEYNSEIERKPNHIWDIIEVSNIDIFDENSIIKVINEFRDIINSKFPVINWSKWVKK
jgi:deoxyadenosine/deoxycytidine kinase